MKHLLAILFFLVTKGIYSQVAADELTLSEKVKMADLVFEGRIIKDSFPPNDNSVSYAIHYVLISKEFKGLYSSDTIVVVTRDWRYVQDANGPILQREMEGIFFCNPLNYNWLRIKPGKDYYQINLTHSCDGFIEIPPVTFHEAVLKANSCNGQTFDNIEMNLYQAIEDISGKKYVRLRPSLRELNKAKAAGK